MKPTKSLCRTLAVLAFLPIAAGSLHAKPFQVEKVPSATAVMPAQMKPDAIVLSDHQNDKLSADGSGLIRFEDWTREKPLQKQFLSPFPDYREPTIQVSVNGIVKPHTEKLHMYVVEARFMIARPAASIDLTRYARLDVLEKIDPAIKHRIITPEQTRPATSPDSAHNRHPERPWCSAPQSLCIESRYPLEGKIPTGIRLANKLGEGGKKISEFMEFQSELRVLQPHEIDQVALSRLTGLDAPVSGVLQQTIFDVNQVMQFGKLLVVLQNHPEEEGKTVATVFMALGIETDVLERRREFENIPVLRNLIPVQVLMGRSSFNSGNSISAGLPDYTSNRIKAVADLLGQ